MKQAIIQLETLSCPSCLQKINKAVKSVNGVDEKSVQVYFNASKVKVSYNPALTSIEVIQKKIATQGYAIINTKFEQ